VLEDLGQEYQRLSDYYGTAAWKGNLLSTAAELPDLHRAMSEWSMDIDPPSYLLQFDRAFSSALTVYAKNNLEHYVRSTGDGMVAKLVESWPRIAEAHESVGSYGTRVVGLIHGDYHPANIYVHRKEIGRLKLVDWEWTGWGKPHADLAALLKRQPPETEEAALLKYSRQDRRLSAREHRKLYEWCQLERGLLDAAFLARQQMGSARKLNWITDFIRKSALRALRAQEQLSLLI
jgi:aminoglycoside/choline kinase family phosphotransferase